MSQQSSSNQALKKSGSLIFSLVERPRSLIAVMTYCNCLAVVLAILLIVAGGKVSAQNLELGEDLKISKSIPKVGVKSLAGIKPLSGQVSVTESKEKTNSTRLKRAQTPVLPPGEAPILKPSADNNKGDGEMSTLFPLKEAGGVKEDTILKEDSNFKEDSKLKGAVSQEELKARQVPYRWNISVYGGYYDASGQIPGVVRGDKLYLYGGTMSDGLTPAPRGPVSVNAQGHFKWQPVGGN
jgi:hypothetical protein